jgi:hypothetical protein
MDSWPARQRWQDLDYLRAIAGARTIPVEVCMLPCQFAAPAFWDIYMYLHPCLHCAALSMHLLTTGTNLQCKHITDLGLQVGQHYLAAEWGQRLMTLSDFIDQHLLPAASDSSGTAGERSVD